MSCDWDLSVNEKIVYSGNQSTFDEIFNLLLKKDFHDEEIKYCLFSIKEFRTRLELIGYSRTSCDFYLIEFKNKALMNDKQNIWFRDKNFRPYQPSGQFWNDFNKLDFNYVIDIWKKYLNEDNLDVNIKSIFDILLNSSDSEHFHFFDQNINYYILTFLFPQSELIKLNVSSIIAWEYLTPSDFLVDRFNENLWEYTSKNTLIRYSNYPSEENQICEFKEIKGNNPLSSIKDTFEKNLIGFLNSKGGEIIWGISNSSEIIGFDVNPRIKDEIRKFIYDKIKNIKPIVTLDIVDIDFLQIIENGKINDSLVCLKCTVKKGNSEELYFTGDLTWIRRDGVTIGLKGYDLYLFLKEKYRNDA